MDKMLRTPLRFLGQRNMGKYNVHKQHLRQGFTVSSPVLLCVDHCVVCHWFISAVV